MTVISVSDVRRTCGIGSSEISDADVEGIILEAESAVERYMNTKITAKEIIETLSSDMGVNSESIYLTQTPVLNVRAARVGTAEITPKFLDVYKGSGKVVLNSNAEKGTWDGTKDKNNSVKYLYGLLEDAPGETTTSAAINSGTGTSLTLASSGSFGTSDWIKIVGMDLNEEVTQIDAIDGNNITVDLYRNHETGSKVVKQDAPYVLKRFVNIIASMMMVARIVGESYTDIVGYGIEGFTVQKGEPYTQWRETYNQLDSERKRLLESLRPRTSVW